MRLPRFTAAAQRDFDEISAHIEHSTGDDRQADTVLLRIVEQCNRLAELPGTLGRPRPDLGSNLRSFPFRGYVIFFRYEDEEFVVLNVLSARRDIDAHFEDEDD